MKHHFCVICALLEGDVQAPGRQEPDSNILKCVLLDMQVVHVLKLVLTGR